MRAVRVTRGPMPKLYVFGHRSHHGMTGMVMIAGGIVAGGQAGAMLIVGGAGLCWHDRHDFPWLTDSDSYRFIGPRTGLGGIVGKRPDKPAP